MIRPADPGPCNFLPSGRAVTGDGGSAVPAASYPRAALGSGRLHREPAHPGGSTAGDPCRLIGASAPMQAVYDFIERVAATRATVLISGETGTGKEIVAHAIHSASRRSDQVFLPMNCGG